VACEQFRRFDPTRVPSPCWVVDEAQVERNLRLLADVQARSGARVLAALKAFSMFALGPLEGRYLSGTCASGLFEARLGREEYGGEVHTFCAAYDAAQLADVLELSDHVIFNSTSQWHRFRDVALAAQVRRPQLRFGLRINPEHSEGTVPIYDPCAPGSRLGIPASRLRESDMDGISGLHFHTLCEQDLPPLARTLEAVERGFGHLFPRLSWINFGGGHHITRADYQVEELVALVRDFRARTDLDVYLEPGEAVALDAGVLVAEVLDITWNELDQAILDTSATCHMPDVIEMPYRPDVIGAGEPGEHPHTYRLGGQTCLAGDRIGDYSFPAPLEVGQRLMFEEMAFYTMVKTSTFNGIPLPAIALWNSDTDALRVVREFGYEDFKSRLS
jgi:carboxynorspermidine decarboxylase